MRLFTGLDVPYEMRRNLELLLQHLVPKARIQWSSLANLHVTTKFIGEWPDARLGELQEALTGAPHPGELKIGVQGLGWFPNPRVPRVLYADIKAPPALADLAAQTETICARLGVAGENREYRPHLTLARIGAGASLQELRTAIDQLPSTDFGAFRSSDFFLYRSQPGPRGSIYTKLVTYSLL
jgi:RNA 2',3'-cyclic 3'-phosphodiesterase